MADQFGPKRPLGVTIVAALAIVSGVFDVIGGVSLLVAGDAEAADRFGGAGVLTTVAIVSIAIGVLMLVIAVGLLRGNAVARVAATIVQAFSLASSIWIGIAEPSQIATEIVSALIALAILLLLWSGESSRYFRGLAPDQPTA
jgi:hypothetical protein